MVMPPFLNHALVLVAVGVLIVPDVLAQAAPISPKPTLSNVLYGKHERQVLDFY
jgi:hypothetical protein